MAIMVTLTWHQKKKKDLLQAPTLTCKKLIDGMYEQLQVIDTRETEKSYVLILSISFKEDYQFF